MSLPIPLWFVQRGFHDRRRPANRLKRATREAEILEEGRIDLWLELGRIALSNGLPHDRQLQVDDEEAA
jgi:hypothetical protein